MNSTTLEKKKVNKIRRKHKIRKSVSGTIKTPRISFFVSLRRLSVQVIDDVNGNTICSSSCLGKNIASGQKLAEDLTAKLTENKITRAVFDRNGKKYWGVVKAFCDSLREKGIKV